MIPKEIQARNFSPKHPPDRCELCKHRYHGQQRFVLEDHVLCKEHFTKILRTVSSKIVEYNGMPLDGIAHLVKELETGLKQGK